MLVEVCTRGGVNVGRPYLIEKGRGRERKIGSALTRSFALITTTITSTSITSCLAFVIMS